MFTVTRWVALGFMALAATSVRAADLSKYLPDDTEIVIGVDLSVLKESAVIQKHVPTLVKRFGPDLIKLVAESSGQKVDDEALKEIAKFVGDPDVVRKWLKQDILRRFIVGASADFDDASVFMIWECNLERDQVKAFIAFLMATKPLGIAIREVKEGKHELYGVKVPGDDEEMFFALPDDKNIVSCQDRAVLAKVLDRAAARKEPGVRKELIDVAQRVERNASIWVAAAPKESDEYVTAHASVIVSDKIKLVGSITAKDADAAKTTASDVKDGLKDAAETLDDAAKQLPPLGMLRDVLKKIELKADKNVVTVEAEMTAAMIDKLVKDLQGSR
jgi:hypothetical protein